MGKGANIDEVEGLNLDKQMSNKKTLDNKCLRSQLKIKGLFSLVIKKGTKMKE